LRKKIHGYPYYAGPQRMKCALAIQLVTPEYFSRGSSPKLAWILAKNMRE
jgi:hypothetical protein